LPSYEPLSSLSEKVESILECIAHLSMLTAWECIHREYHLLAI